MTKYFKEALYAIKDTAEDIKKEIKQLFGAKTK